MQSLSDYPLAKMLGIKYPIIMAPMFLISNTRMVKAALDSGITGAIPALNYRSIRELEAAIHELKEYQKGPFGFNLITNQSNFKYKEQLEMLCRHQVDYIITSLGSPRETIERAHERGMKVFCDVTDLRYAEKVVKLGADALIAVNSRAEGIADRSLPKP
jgi:nitronate monooxygenase